MSLTNNPVIKFLGAVLEWAFIIVVIAGLSPLILTVYLCYATYAGYDKLWSILRGDPSVKMVIENLKDEAWERAQTKEDFIEAFTKLTHKITALSDASASPLEYKGFEYFDNPQHDIDWIDLELAQTLKTKHAEVRVSLDFGAVPESGESGFYVGMTDGDEQSGTLFPPVSIEVVKPSHDGAKVAFTLYGSDSVWAAVSILRGDVKFAGTRRQLWAYVSEYDAWLVQYKNHGSDYGIRKTFTGFVAHKFRFDDKQLS